MPQPQICRAHGLDECLGALEPIADHMMRGLDRPDDCTEASGSVRRPAGEEMRRQEGLQRARECAVAGTRGQVLTRPRATERTDDSSGQRFAPG